MDRPPIDLRSDTVTKPTAAMRRAMAEAEVGDDVYGEDPTTNRLEERAAEIFGKEAGLFVPSGTMGNTIAVKIHTRHGQEVICETRSHVFNYELSMLAWFSGCLARPVSAEDGILSWEQIREQVRPPHAHFAPTGLVELENTHNMAGGTVYPVEVIGEICDGAHALGLKVHLDGARVFHAATCLCKPVAELTARCDTVMFCLSKGLGAPVGSLICADKERIVKLRRLRKMFGGGMRQAGILAAAGLYALDHNIARLAEDHAHAKRLAATLAQLPGVTIDPAHVETNIVVFDISETRRTADEVLAALKAEGLLLVPFSPTTLRAVTHLDASSDQVEQACAILKKVFTRLAA